MTQYFDAPTQHTYKVHRPNVLHFILTKVVLGWSGDVRCGDDDENHKFPFDVTYVGYSRFCCARGAVDRVVKVINTNEPHTINNNVDQVSNDARRALVHCTVGDKFAIILLN